MDEKIVNSGLSLNAINNCNMQCNAPQYLRARALEQA